MTALAASALAFAGELEACGDVPAVATLFAAAAAKAGMTASACGMVSGPKALSPDPFHFINWPADWLQLYQERGFQQIDAVPRWAMVSGAPIAWSELLPRLPRDDPGRIVHAEAARWGFREGYVTPVRSREGDLGLVGVAGPRGALTSEEKVYLQAVSSAALHRAQALTPADSTAENGPFTLRERDSVALLCQGFTNREIAAVLGISDRAVRSHVDHARAKAGPPEQALRRLFGLTRAETRVALALFEGSSLREAAATLGVSFQTVRNQLTHVFAKTNTNRQAELVRLMMRVVGADLV